MLVLIDTPLYVSNLYERAKELGREIFGQVGAQGRPQPIEEGTDVLAWPDPVYVYVKSGVLKFIDGRGGVVRYYSEGDFVSAGHHDVHHHHVLVEDPGEVVVFGRDGFVEGLSSAPDLLRQWMELQELESRIMHILGSLFLDEELAPDIKVANYEKGDVILEEGSDADEIFLLVEGSAGVFSEGTRVGSVTSGEVFGEISFLTGEQRTATVVAESSCLVQVADNDAFTRLIRSRPQVAVDMSRALARRIVALNEKVKGSH